MSYILVEGHEPDIYDNALRGLLKIKGTDDSNWIVESGSDKYTILNFRKTTKAKNFYAILDGDFDGEIEPLERVTYLDRYSIENYLFDLLVIRQCLCRVLKRSAGRIDIDTNLLMEYYEQNLAELLSYVKKYQLSENNKNISWSDEKVLIKDCWEVSTDVIGNLIKKIKLDHPDIVPCDLDDLDFKKNVPGKMLVRGIYYYIKKIISPPKFSAIFNNEKVFFNYLLTSIENSEDFMQCLDGPKKFLRSRHPE